MVYWYIGTNVKLRKQFEFVKRKARKMVIPQLLVENVAPRSRGRQDACATPPVSEALRKMGGLMDEPIS